MKLKYSFETVEMGEKIIIVPVGEGATQIQGILRLNKEGLEVLNLIKTHTSIEQIISTLADKYENDREQLALEFQHKVDINIHNIQKTIKKNG